MKLKVKDKPVAQYKMIWVTPEVHAIIKSKAEKHNRTIIGQLTEDYQ